jgi:hypothetical protein
MHVASDLDQALAFEARVEDAPRVSDHEAFAIQQELLGPNLAVALAHLLAGRREEIHRAERSVGVTADVAP